MEKWFSGRGFVAARDARRCSGFARIATADRATAAILAGSTQGDSSCGQPIVAISKQSMAEKRTGYVSVLIDDADADTL